MNATNTPATEATQEDTTTRSVYRVIATTCQAFCIYVEAASSEEAFDIADHVDGFHYKPYGPGDWEVDHAELVIDATPIELLPREAYDTL